MKNKMVVINHLPGLIQEGRIHSLGFQAACFQGLPELATMEFGWFDLSEDANPRIENDVLLLDLWFYANAFLPNNTERIKGKIVVNGHPYILLTVCVNIDDIEYIALDGERIYLHTRLGD